MNDLTLDPHVSHTDPADSVRLTIGGRESDRELDALAGWLRGNALFSNGWSVSRVRSKAEPSFAPMGPGDLDTLLVILQSGIGLAELVVAVKAWQAARAAKGRVDITINVIHRSEVITVGQPPAPPSTRDDGREPVTDDDER